MSPAEFASRRHALALTQAQLAAALGCSHQSVAAWEQGTRAVPVWAIKSMEHLKALDSNTTS